MIKLHVFPLSPRAFKVLAVAEYLGLDYESVFVDLGKGAHRTPEFAALNPNMRMPVMEDGDFVLWESGAIMQYLALKNPEAGLLPTEPRRLADVTRWHRDRNDPTPFVYVGGVTPMSPAITVQTRLVLQSGVHVALCPMRGARDRIADYERGVIASFRVN